MTRSTRVRKAQSTERAEPSGTWRCGPRDGAGEVDAVNERASGKQRKVNAVAAGGLRQGDDGRWRARDQLTTGMDRSGPWAPDLAR